MPIDAGIYSLLDTKGLQSGLQGIADGYLKGQEHQGRLAQLAMEKEKFGQQQEAEKQNKQAAYMQNVSRDIFNNPENKDFILEKYAGEALKYGVDPNHVTWLAQDLSNAKDINELRDRALYHANPKEYEKQMLEEKFKQSRSAVDEVFKTVQDKDGNMFGVTKSGKTIPLGIDGQPLVGQNKPAFSAYQAVPMIDPETGETIWGQFDKNRGGVSPVTGKIKNPIYSPNVQGAIAGAKATGKEVGQATGENIVKLKDMEAMMPRLETVVSELSDLGKKATYTLAGQGVNIGKRQLGMKVGDAAVARKEYISKVDNEILPLLRQTFGAQFTQKEGESLKITLGDPNASPEEKDAVLKSFIETKYGQIAALQRRNEQGGQQTRRATDTKAGFDADKEARYQAWKAQQGK